MKKIYSCSSEENQRLPLIVFYGKIIFFVPVPSNYNSDGSENATKQKV